MGTAYNRQVFNSNIESQPTNCFFVMKPRYENSGLFYHAINLTSRCAT
jgi:hypothetical protein